MLKQLRRVAGVPLTQRLTPATSMTVTVHSSSSGPLEPTRVNLLPIPPQVLKLLTVGGLFVLDAFWRAHRHHADKMEKAEKENAVGGQLSRTMSNSEALQILGLSDTHSVPLKDIALRAEAQSRFEELFRRAGAANSPYLQGKISAAYRRCVNETWDEPVNGK